MTLLLASAFLIALELICLTFSALVYALSDARTLASATDALWGIETLGLTLIIMGGFFWPRLRVARAEFDEEATSAQRGYRARIPCACLWLPCSLPCSRGGLRVAVSGGPQDTPAHAEPLLRVGQRHSPVGINEGGAGQVERSGPK